jgi:hypothetical protein
MSLAADIAVAVVGELNGGTFSQSFTAVRTYLPVYDLAEMADLHVTVVPKGVTSQVASRDASQLEISIDIAVQKKLLSSGAADTAEIDVLMDLCEEIADFLRQRRLAAFPAAAWVRTDHVAIYSPEHLEQLRQFTSVMTVIYRAMVSQ